MGNHMSKFEHANVSILIKNFTANMGYRNLCSIIFCWNSLLIGEELHTYANAG